MGVSVRSVGAPQSSQREPSQLTGEGRRVLFSSSRYAGRGTIHVADADTKAKGVVKGVVKGVRTSVRHMLETEVGKKEGKERKGT
jgi:hypothetical protein